MQEISQTKQISLDNFKSLSLPWVIWILGAAFYFYENLLQVSPSVMVKDLMNAFQVNATALGGLASFYFYAYAFIQIPAGILIDNYSIKKVLCAAVFLCINGCLLFLSAKGLLQASLGRFLIGLGSGFAAITSMKLATMWFPARQFSFLVGLMVTLGMTGSIVGDGPLAVLVTHIGWQASLLMLSIFGCILFVLIAYFVQERKLEQHSLQGNIFSGLKEIVTCSNSWLLAIYAGLMFSPTAIFGGLWGPPFISEFYQISRSSAATLVSMLFVGWVIGGPLSGKLTQYWDEKKLMLSGSIGAMTSICLILYVHFNSLPLLGFIIFIFGFFSSCFLPSFSLIKNLHKPIHSGVVLGFMNTANTLGGAIGLPIVGIILDELRKQTSLQNIKYTASDFQLALSILPIFISIALVLIVIILIKQYHPKTIRETAEKRQ